MKGGSDTLVIQGLGKGSLADNSGKGSDANPPGECQTHLLRLSQEHHRVVEEIP